MRRPTLLLLGVVAVAVAAYTGRRMLASDETRIRWLLEDAARSFNEAYLAGCLEAFDNRYQDTSSTPALDRTMLAATLRYVFQLRVDLKTKAFLLRVRIPEEELTIQVGRSGEQAEARFRLDLEEQLEGAWQSAWQLQVTANLQEAGGDWRIRQSSHETAAGRPPR